MSIGITPTSIGEASVSIGMSPMSIQDRPEIIIETSIRTNVFGIFILKK